MGVVSLESDEVAEAGKCQTMGDIFQPPARRLVGRVCREYLDQKKLCATELMTDIELVIEFANTGQDQQRATQLLAGAQARSFNFDLHKRMRTLLQMSDKVRELLQANSDNGLIPNVPAGGVKTLVDSMAGKDEGTIATLVFAGISARLKAIREWEAKLSWLLDMAEKESSPEAVYYLESYIADILDSQQAQKALFGEINHLSVRLREVADLFRGEFKAKKDHPGAKTLTRLNSLMGRYPWPDGLPQIRLSLELIVQRSLTSGIPIARGGGIEPLLELCRTYEHLKFKDHTIGGEKVVEAIETRMGRQAEPENLILLLQDDQTVVQKIKALTELQDRMIGDANKRSVNTLIKGQFDRREFPKDLLDLGDTPTQKLKVVSDLYDHVMDSDIPEGMKERFGEALEEIQMGFIKETKLFAKINKSSRNVSETVMKLVDLCRGGMFTKGQNMLYVHSLIKHQLGQSDFMKAYLAGVKNDEEKQKKVQDLKKRLLEAGIDNMAGGKAAESAA